MNIETLIGKTLTSCEQGHGLDSDEIIFKTTDGKTYRLLHDQYCCESVDIQDINGDLQDLVGSPITTAYESSNRDDPPKGEYTPESYTWTFYRLGTAKGFVVIRWYGESNGYYSESVSFAEFKPSGERIW